MTPFVKVDNQEEFDKVLGKMLIETGLKKHYSTQGYDDVFSALGVYNYEGEDWIFMLNPNHCENKHLKIIPANDYINGNKDNFTISKLEDGMVVETRNKLRFLLLNNTLLSMNSHIHGLDNYNSDMSHNFLNDLDILKIYKRSNTISLSEILNYDNLTLIFDAEAHRNKLTIETKKVEIQSQIEALKLQLEELNG